MRIALVLHKTLQLDGHAFIAELYREIFSREPDPGGLQHHAELLASGMSKIEIAAKLLQSRESVARNGLDETEPPLEYYQSTLDWIHTLNLEPSEIGVYYQPFECEDMELHSHPKGPDSSFRELFEYIRQISKPLSQFVAVVPEGRVVGSMGAVISPDNKLLWDVSIQFNKPGYSHTIFSETRLPPVRRTTETVAVLTSSGSYNYYHWTFDVLTRIELLRRSGISIDKYIISRCGNFPYQDETLTMLGIPKEKLIECDDHTHLKAKTLVVPSMAGYTGHVPRWLCHWLRKQVISNRSIKPLDGYNRIFISRAQAKQRRIANENDVLNVLHDYGFRSVQLETLSVSEQARIFSSANVIVSPHGAGLANLTYCRPGTKLIEIFSPKYVNLCYWILSEKTEVDYYYLIGEGEPAAHSLASCPEDINVNLQELSDIMGLLKDE